MLPFCRPEWYIECVGKVANSKGLPLHQTMLTGGFETFMLTEFEVRRELELIQKSDAPPSAKARKLLRIGKKLRRQARDLEVTQDLAQRLSDVNTDRHLERMQISARMLREEIRGIALSLLRAGPRYRLNVKSS